MRFVEVIKGFDLDHPFYNHIVAVGPIPSLINTLVYGEEEGDSHDPNVQGVDRNPCDIKTNISTAEPHKERGNPSNEKRAHSHVVSIRSVLPKVNPHPESLRHEIASTTIEVSDTKFISSSMLMTRQQIEEQIEGLKKASDKKFDTMVEFTHDDIDS
jgi:hypothetical protein